MPRRVFLQMDALRPACDACRTKKRKCDKAEPVCSQCSIRECGCVYSHHLATNKRRKQQPPQHPPEGRGVADRPDDLSYPTPRQSADTYEPTALRVPLVELPASSFLDRVVHSELRTRLPFPPELSYSDPAAMGLVEHINAEGLCHVSSFMNGIQSWLPVFSEDQLRRHVDAALQLTMDVALLMQCMGLVASKPCAWSNGPRTQLYLACKHGFSDLETAGVLSIAGLQAGLLISLYEINHAVYPAAFLTTGACARYGLALGLGSRNKSRLCPPVNRTEHEESKRLYWAVLLLNSQAVMFMALGHATPDIIGNDPHDEKQVHSTLDSEEMASANVFSNNAPSRSDKGCVTLLIESTKLVGQVLRLLLSKSSDTRTSSDTLQSDKLLLDRTLNSLISAAEDEAKKWDIDIEDQITICYSSLLALHQPHPASRLGEPYQAEYNRSAVQDVTQKVLSRCRKILTTPEVNLDSISPFFIHSIYRVAVASTSFNPEESSSYRALVEQTLQKLNERWKVAGAYLELLQVQEVMRL